MGQKMQSLLAALTVWDDMQAIVDEAVILVRDFTCYGDPSGIVVKVNGEEPEGVHNGYCSARKIEQDLVTVVPGYVKGAAIWREVEDDESLEYPE